LTRRRFESQDFASLFYSDCLPQHEGNQPLIVWPVFGQENPAEEFDLVYPTSKLRNPSEN